MMKTENHPLEPFLPGNARILMLGSFPPKRERWSMDFFYPNFNNDMWRIFGMVFFGDKSHFVARDGKHFDKDAITGFCAGKGIALYDTATQVRRLKDNASDKFLEIVVPTDLKKLLSRIPQCHILAATGQKAAETAAAALHCDVPQTGEFVSGHFLSEDWSAGREASGNGPAGKIREAPEFRLWRMPSSSRAYPLSIEAKADVYRKMFDDAMILPACAQKASANCTTKPEVPFPKP